MAQRCPFAPLAQWSLSFESAYWCPLAPHLATLLCPLSHEMPMDSPFGRTSGAYIRDPPVIQCSSLGTMGYLCNPLAIGLWILSCPHMTSGGTLCTGAQGGTLTNPRSKNLQEPIEIPIVTHKYRQKLPLVALCFAYFRVDTLVNHGHPCNSGTNR